MKELCVWKEIVKKIIQISKTYILFCVLNAFAKSLIMPVLLIFPSKIIDGVAEWKGVYEITFWVLLCVGIPAALNGVSSILESQIACKAKMVENGLDWSVNQILVNVDYEKLENPEILGKIQSLQDAKNMVGSLTSVIQNQITNYLTNGLRIIFCIPILIQLIGTDYILPDSRYLNTVPEFLKKISAASGVFLAAAIALGIFSIHLKRRTEVKRCNIIKRFSNVEREYGYYTSLLADYENGADIRLNNLSDFLEHKRKSYMHDEREMFLTLGKIESKSGLILTLISKLELIGFYTLVISKILCGMISVGGLYLYINAILQFLECIDNSFQQINELSIASAYYEAYPFLWKLNLTCNQVEKKEENFVEPCDTNAAIEFRGVSFRYPGSSKWVIRNLNLSIKSNERIAIVGPNGAGKSTLIKLMMGLFEPQEGCIYVNGREINSYTKRELYSLFGVVFQDNHFLASTVGNNVASGERYDLDKVRKAIMLSGLSERLGQCGEEKQFSRYLSEQGIIFSGGEEQKLAIARMIYKASPIFIMDEPTASLDPVSEKNMNDKMLEITRNHTAILISHRLSCCTECDKIIVLRKGNITELGTHRQLLEKNGLYALMWKLQSQYYNETSS